MKKTILGILIFFVLITMGFFIWWNLPLSINRRSDIKLGDQIIENIERYQNQYGLPENTDWKTLRKLNYIFQLFHFVFHNNQDFYGNPTKISIHNIPSQTL